MITTMAGTSRNPCESGSLPGLSLLVLSYCGSDAVADSKTMLFAGGSEPVKAQLELTSHARHLIRFQIERESRHQDVDLSGSRRHHPDGSVEQLPGYPIAYNRAFALSLEFPHVFGTQRISIRGSLDDARENATGKIEWTAGQVSNFDIAEIWKATRS